MAHGARTGRVTLAVLALLAGAACASEGPAPPVPPASPSEIAVPSPDRIALVKRYFAAIKLEERMQKLMASLTPALIGQADKGVAGATEKKDAVIAAVEEAAAEWMPRYMDRMAIEYAHVMTDDEIMAAINFYESPSGKSIVAKEGAMAPIATKVMLEMQPALQALTLERLCKKIDCRPSDRPAATVRS